MIKECVHVVDSLPKQPTAGSAGLNTQVSGCAATVSSLARATGGIGRGRFVERDTK